MTKKIIFVNGPARSGKDTLGEIIVDQLPGAVLEKLANPLKCGTHGLFNALTGGFEPGVSFEDWGEATNSVKHAAFYEASKGDPLPRFLGMTPREAYIAVSEILMKLVFGEDIFGRLMVARLEQVDADVVVITDSGFTAEALPIIERYGAENCKVIRISRPGYTFDQSADPKRWKGLIIESIAAGEPLKDLLSQISDSRSYIDIPCQTYPIRNEGSVDALKVVAQLAIDALL